MKKAISLLLPMLLLVPLTALAEGPGVQDQKGAADRLIGAGMAGMGTADGPVGPAEEELKAGERTGRYRVHFKNGGTLETDNYVLMKDSVKVSMPSGAIYLDRAMVKSIEEVEGLEDETVRTTPVEPPQSIGGTYSPAATQGQQGGGPVVVQPPSGTFEMTDNNGHDEYWWKVRVEEWKKKKKDAAEKYEKAREDWNNYDGTLNNLVSGGDASQYDVIRYQDLRGAARVDMDRSKAEMDAADRMLNETLPDEARKAGAPPGWAR